jgi:ribosomal protein L11 methylase PrmA
MVLSNILRSANTALLPVVASALAAEGIAIYSGMETTEAPLFCRALESAGFTVLEEIRDTGWWGVAARWR